ncbi:hypothetical protein J6590_077513 [Homalodisca vitripennis]|nr:hypothetical protein J6590_077513 [Homalodisca vitripennis]
MAGVEMKSGYLFLEDMVSNFWVVKTCRSAARTVEFLELQQSSKKMAGVEMKSGYLFLEDMVSNFWVVKTCRSAARSARSHATLFCYVIGKYLTVEFLELQQSSKKMAGVEMKSGYLFLEDMVSNFWVVKTCRSAARSARSHATLFCYVIGKYLYSAVTHKDCGVP